MRKSFDFSQVPPLTWFPGHMANSINDMKQKLHNKIDFVFEVRDARIPLSSINAQFEEIFKDKKRIIIYNKTDLSSINGNNKLKTMVVSTDPTTKPKGDANPILLSAHKKQNVSSIIESIKARYEGQLLPPGHSLLGLVVGMPNVGKSTLINSLRSYGMLNEKKAVRTGKLPGVTVTISGKIKILEKPLVYILDSPGIMLPNLKDKETALKLALTGGIADKIVGEFLLADYLLFLLNQFNNKNYREIYCLSEWVDDIDKFLPLAAMRMGMVAKGGGFDLSTAAKRFVKFFQEGKFGRFTLDDI